MQGIAKKTCDVLPMLCNFHSAVVDVLDLDAATSDYARLLGQQPAWIETNVERRTRSALFVLSNMIFELRGTDNTVEGGAKGLAGIRLGCDELDRFKGQLESRGISTGPAVVEKAAEQDGESARTWVSAVVDAEASRSISLELISDEAGSMPKWTDRGLDRAQPRAIDPQSAIQALDHVVVFSADVEATRDFYGEGLGIRLALDRTFEDRGVRLLFFRIAGVTIEIGGRLGAEAQPDATDRFGGLAWQVPDIDAIQSRLKADRFDVSEIRHGNKPGTRVCTVRDPVHDVPTLLIEPLS
jgi:catechol 2,3-dioxygenase-like lactoylglutathione lyase family enzyme